MNRLCTSCGTKLPGKGHGWPTKKGGILCGRTEVQKSVRNADGSLSLMKVKTPECVA